MLLKVGSEGEDVKKLQIKLGVDPIGKFGPKTETAVKEWQKSNGLTADGIVGDGTWAKMFPTVTESVSKPTLITEPSPIKSVGGLKLEKLKGHIPDSVISMIPDTAAKFQIDTPLRLAHFLAQCGHESGGFRLTKENYTAFGKSIHEDILSNPDKVASNYALLSAAWFFSKNGLHKMADGGSSDDVVTKITKRVNGGTIGLADRIKHFKEYYNLLK